jgi:hypothetical protein
VLQGISTLLDLLWDQKIRLEIEQPIELSSHDFQIDMPAASWNCIKAGGVNMMCDVTESSSLKINL